MIIDLLAAVGFGLLGALTGMYSYHKGWTAAEEYWSEVYPRITNPDHSEEL